jgi:hypothetical protein
MKITKRRLRKLIKEVTFFDNDASHADNDAYWEAVGQVVSAKLGVGLALSFTEIGNRFRSISYEIEPEGTFNGNFAIEHNWNQDGTASKPVTTVSIDGWDDETGEDIYVTESLGRFAVWDDPTTYAEDIVDAAGYLFSAVQ